MRLDFNVLYVFEEPGRSDVVKIGTCSKGGWERFREGAFMNPRGLDVIAMWRLQDTAITRALESDARKLYRRLDDADGREWFYAERDQVVPMLSRLIGKEPDFLKENLPFSVSELYSEDKYDELGERGDRYKGRLVQRRIWIHEEIGGEFRKVSQNTWWCESGSRSTNAKRTTYNTRRLGPVACLAIPIDETAPDWETLVEIANKRTVCTYLRILENFAVCDRPSGRVGWTRASSEQLTDELIGLGFKKLEIDPQRPPKGVKSLKFPNQ